MIFGWAELPTGRPADGLGWAGGIAAPRFAADTLGTGSTLPEKGKRRYGKERKTTWESRTEAVGIGAAAELRAADGNVCALAGNTTGLITATGSQVIHGQVWLTSNSGSVRIQGRIAAKNNDGTGGTITATGGKVILSGWPLSLLNCAALAGRFHTYNFLG